MLINILLYCVFFSRHQQLTKLLSRYIHDPLHHKPSESHGKYFSRVSSRDENKNDDYGDDDNSGTLTRLYVFYHVSSPTSSVLLDTVFSNPEWRCHPADSSHVGRLRGDNLWFAFPLAGQKHLHTVPPHDHVPKVFTKRTVCTFLTRSTYFTVCCVSVDVSSAVFPGCPTRSTWEPSELACSIPCSASMEK